MPNNNVTISIDGTKFDAVHAEVHLNTLSDLSGMPKMGSHNINIQATIDFHDDNNVPYDTISKLFDLSYIPTQDKIKDMKVTFWADNSQQKALVSYKFQGWISHYATNHVMPADSQSNQFNHQMVLTLQPKLNQKGIPDVTVANG